MIPAIRIIVDITAAIALTTSIVFHHFFTGIMLYSRNVLRRNAAVDSSTETKKGLTSFGQPFLRR